MRKYISTVPAVVLAVFLTANICYGELQGVMSLTTRSRVDTDSTKTWTYAPFLNINFQDQIAAGTRITTGLQAQLGSSQTEGYKPLYTGRLFPSFDFTTSNSRYSFNGGYRHIINSGESEVPFLIEELTQTQLFYSGLSLPLSDLPSFNLQGRQIHNFSLNGTKNDLRDSIGLNSGYSAGLFDISVNAGWNRYKDYINLSGGIPYEENNFNETVNTNINYQPASRITVKGKAGLSGYQSRRGFANNTDLNRNSSYYTDSTLLLKFTDSVSTTGNLSWNRTDRETETGSTVTKLPPVESIRGGGGIYLKLYKFLFSNISYQGQWQIGENAAVNTAGIGLDFIPFKTMKTSLVYGLSETSRDSGKLTRSDKISFSAKGKVYDRVDINSFLQYNRIDDYKQDVIMTLWMAGSKIKSRLIDDWLVKSMDVQAGYNRMWQIIDLGGEREVLIIDVTNISVHSRMTRVIGISGKWSWNNKPGGLSLTQQYAMEWLPLKKMRLSVGYGITGSTDKSIKEDISARANLSLPKNYTLSAAFGSVLNRDNPESPRNGSYTFSATISASF
ncbi:MAG: hypothetical protein GXP33_15740 [Spirochaetes bacterium]|nr:hypothetical protein [Spirochaetota bacterium]